MRTGYILWSEHLGQEVHRRTLPGVVERPPRPTPTAGWSFRRSEYIPAVVNVETIGLIPEREDSMLILPLKRTTCTTAASWTSSFRRLPLRWSVLLDRAAEPPYQPGAQVEPLDEGGNPRVLKPALGQGSL